MQLLIVLAVLQTVLYGAIYALHDAFQYDSIEQQRPILLVLALFAVIFVLYLFAIRVATRCPITSQLAWVILVSAFVFRLVLLTTSPIQEIDYYRYLWDGAVTAHGSNPYRYAPAQVLNAAENDSQTEELNSLVRLRESSPGLAEVLARIHYAKIPTLYPPVSQAVFALGDLVTPHTASVDTRVVMIKTLIVLFDGGTIGLVWLILITAGKHPGWVIAYAWCPLILKEFANSGHLDSITIFFTTAAVWCLVKLYPATTRRVGFVYLLGGGLLLSLAIGAKIYPVVLIPGFVAAVAATRGLRWAAVFLGTTSLLTALCLAPLLLTEPAEIESATTDVVAPGENPTPESSPKRPETGLKAFVTQWEMNDFLFMLVVENLKPTDQDTVWFAIVPSSWREAIIHPLATALETDNKQAAFLLARVLTSGIFLVIALALAWWVFRSATLATFLEATFLTLAWFWLLSPTQNPWYWTWALPFLPFARNRAWYAVSGLAGIYYLRFWLRYHFADSPLLGTGYEGADFFDFLVTWVEYFPWFVWLGVSAFVGGTFLHSRSTRQSIGPCVANLTDDTNGCS